MGHYDPYSQQHICVQRCLFWGYGNDVGSALGCDTPYNNVCYCPTSQAAAASSYLSSCVSTTCSAGDLPADVTSAVSVYNNYCQTAGFTLTGAVPAPSSPPITSSAAQPAKPTTVFATTTVYVTKTASSGTSLVQPRSYVWVLGLILHVCVTCTCLALNFVLAVGCLRRKSHFLPTHSIFQPTATSSGA
jgi:hypothetical protein